jgi:hypothetical protein
MMRDESRRYRLSKEQIICINPNTKSCPTFKTSRDRDITVKIYELYPILINDETKKNPWGITYYRMFDMAMDSDLFANNTLENLVRLGFEIGKDGISKKDSELYLPLWEAKEFQQKIGS